MDLYKLGMFFFLGVFFFGGLALQFQIYKMTVIDARARGLKHPRFWGLFNIGGNNSSGNIILYLLGRRKYPIKDLGPLERHELLRRKRMASTALIFFLLGFAGFTIFLIKANLI